MVINISANFLIKHGNKFILGMIIIASIFYFTQTEETHTIDYSAIQVLYPEDLEDIVIESNNTYTGGGGGTTTPSPNQTITSISICTSSTGNCNETSPYTNDIVIFWEVQNGIGCCSTYNCDLELFTSVCLEPSFNLYEITLDETTITPGEEYVYSCETSTPYNYVTYQNLTTGLHELNIKQKDCFSIKDEVNVFFELINTGDEYIINI